MSELISRKYSPIWEWKGADFSGVQLDIKLYDLESGAFYNPFRKALQLNPGNDVARKAKSPVKHAYHGCCILPDCRRPSIQETPRNSILKHIGRE